jgi:hypothetical protein
MKRLRFSHDAFGFPKKESGHRKYMLGEFHAADELLLVDASPGRGPYFQLNFRTRELFHPISEVSSRLTLDCFSFPFELRRYHQSSLSHT